jgi:hypothetical protein
MGYSGCFVIVITLDRALIPSYPAPQLLELLAQRRRPRFIAAGYRGLDTRHDSVDVVHLSVELPSSFMNHRLNPSGTMLGEQITGLQLASHFRQIPLQLIILSLQEPQEFRLCVLPLGQPEVRAGGFRNSLAVSFQSPSRIFDTPDQNL